MRIEQLEYFRAVIQHGSLRNASRHLHLSQPALSEAIRGLERELGVTLLERHRTGARISAQGQHMIQQITAVLDAVASLRAAALDQRQAPSKLRLGTVNAGTSALLFPAIKRFAQIEQAATVEVLNILQTAIHQNVAEGTLDLGLVNLLPGDDVPPGLHVTPLLHGHPAVCCRSDDPFAEQEFVTIDQLRERPFVAMRPGYLMYRYTQRLFGSRPPADAAVTEGAENAKLLVASGVGVTVLPEYSVHDDPLHEAGLITTRPILDATTVVTMVVLRRATSSVAPVTARFEAVLSELADAHPHSIHRRLRSAATLGAPFDPAACH
jgi:DNA-binding transcriptional LysR family regulator